MSNLHFLQVRFSDDEDKPIEIVAATEKGTLRIIPIDKFEAAKLIEDLARMIRMLMLNE